jgi:hypothetical protein
MIRYMPYVNIKAQKKEPNVHDRAFTLKLFKDIYINNIFQVIDLHCAHWLT